VHTRSAITTTGVVIGVVILLAIIVATVAVFHSGTSGVRSSGQRDQKIDPALIQYRQTGKIPVAMRQVRAVAVGPQEQIYVAGDSGVHVLDSHGRKRSEIVLDGEPKCLAVGNAEHVSPGRIYVGMKDHVEVFSSEGRLEGRWDSLGAKALLTSITASERDVFVADAGNRIVWRYDSSGKLLGRIGQRDDRRRIPGFVITSPYFDLAVAPDGLLRVVNPRARRIEAYTFGGDLELFWGKTSAAVEGFFGCCNPAHLAIFPDGRVVTAEKGFPRVKVYSAAGEFICVVAGPQQVPVAAADLAIDARQRVLILDPKTASVRIFDRKNTNSRTEP